MTFCILSNWPFKEFLWICFVFKGYKDWGLSSEFCSKNLDLRFFCRKCREDHNICISRMKIWENLLRGQAASCATLRHAALKQQVTSFPPQRWYQLQLMPCTKFFKLLWPVLLSPQAPVIPLNVMAFKRSFLSFSLFNHFTFKLAFCKPFVRLFIITTKLFTCFWR